MDKNTALFTSKRDSNSAVDHMLDSFRKQLIARKLRPGDLVPSESVLAESLGISRGSVREGMKILSAFGIVDIRRGDGTYISSNIGDSLLDPFLLSLMMTDHQAREMVELREMIELTVCRLAVKHASPEDLEALREALKRMETGAGSGGSLEEWLKLDLNFHHALGKATGNRLVENLYRFVLRYFEPAIESTYGRESNITFALEIHRRIAAAIESRDESAAVAAALNSVREWEAVYLAQMKKKEEG